MVEIIPFRGVRYNPEKVELEKVVAPPYDTIPEAAIEEYYKDENNVVRLILGKEFSGDNTENNKYTRARGYFWAWMKRGILKADDEPSIYAYEEEYEHRGKKKRMLGFIALAKLEPFESGVILPHEETLPKPIEDRLMLIRACRANFSSIFALYSDSAMAVEKLIESEIKKEPAVDIRVEGIRHRVWKISDRKLIKKVALEMKNKVAFIADGHHRYETALRFMEETDSNRYTMMYFTNMDSEGVTILPAHRLLKCNFSASKLRGIEKYFNVRAIDFDSNSVAGAKASRPCLRKSEKAQRKRLFKLMASKSPAHAFGMYLGKNRYYLLTLKDEKILDKIVKAKKSPDWKKLDVAIVHSLLIERILKVKSVAYVIEVEEALRLVKEGEYQTAIFLNATKVEEVKKIALAGERMPGKATYFYPKLLTGLVMNKM